MARKRTGKKIRWKGYAVFALSLLLAFFIWFLHNMSQDYSVRLQYKINLTAGLRGYEPSATSEETLIVRGRGSGFYISRQRFGRKPEVLDIAVDGRILVKDGPELFRAGVGDIREKISEAVGPSFDIEFIDADSLTFKYRERYYRTVPLRDRFLVSCPPQWMQVGPVKFTPDSVDIYGTRDAVDAVDALYCGTVRLNNVVKPHQGIVKIEVPDGVRCSSEDAVYTVRVERYVELNEDVALTVTGLPQGKRLVPLPSRVNITYRTSFGTRSGSGGFVIAVDYDEFIASDSKKVVPHFISSDCEVFSYSISPEVVECILMDE